MARATMNQGTLEQTVVDATNAAVRGETAALSRLPASVQLEAHLRWRDRIDAGEGRVDIVKTGPLAAGAN